MYSYLFPRVWKANKAAKEVQGIAYKMMKNYRKKHGTKEMIMDSRHEFADDTIISRIMNNPNYACDDERAADIAIFLAAGHDTTAYSISWTLLEIFKNHPPELAEYRKKIKGQPRDQWRKVEELEFMIKEGMRLDPVLAMGTVRDVGKEIVYQQGDEKIVLPKDSIYFINLFPMFRNPAYYDDPDEFRPSRWKNPKTEVAHVPFSVGPRNCIGQTLANAELHTVLSVLCARYDFVVEDEGHAEYLTTLKPVGCKLIPKKLF
jgi:cytochrome P450